MSWDEGLAPELAWTIWWMDRVTSSVGYPLRVSSGFRSREKQAELYERWKAGLSGLPAAPPGTSKHEIGLAVDVVWQKTGLREPFDGGWQALGRLGERLGLVWGGRFSTPDPVHFELPAERITP